MAIYKVLTICKKFKTVTTTSGYSYEDEETAYGEHRFFSTPELAKAFCQQYSTSPIVWQEDEDYISGSVTRELEFTICIEPIPAIDTIDMPALPTVFRERHSNGD